MIDPWRSNPSLSRRGKQDRGSLYGLLIARIEQEGLTVRNLGPNGPHLRIEDAVDFWPSTRKRLSLCKHGVTEAKIKAIEEVLDYAYRRLDQDVAREAEEFHAQRNRPRVQRKIEA